MKIAQWIRSCGP